MLARESGEPMSGKGMSGGDIKGCDWPLSRRNGEGGIVEAAGMGGGDDIDAVVGVTVSVDDAGVGTAALGGGDAGTLGCAGGAGAGADDDEDGGFLVDR